MTTNYSPEIGNPWRGSEVWVSPDKIVWGYFWWWEYLWVVLIINELNVIALKYENILTSPLGSCLLGNNNKNKISIK